MGHIGAELAQVQFDGGSIFGQTLSGLCGSAGLHFLFNPLKFHTSLLEIISQLGMKVIAIKTKEF